MNFCLYYHLLCADIIFEWSKTENALAHQACVLQSDLEKALKDNASLFLKIGMLFNLVIAYVLYISLNRNLTL